MITKEVIEAIYKQYNKKPQSTENLDLGLLFEKNGLTHDIMIDPDTEELTIGSLPEDSPFHTINLKNIHGIVPFEEWTAIVLHASIVFLNNTSERSSIHIRPQKDTLWDRIRHIGSRV